MKETDSLGKVGEMEAFEDMEILANRRALEYFAALQEIGGKERFGASPGHWNRRAESWEKQESQRKRGEERIVRTVEYLKRRGVLREEYAVADIGCGPGRFAAAFAKQVKQVVGLDLSERMIHYGREHLQREGIENAVLRVCDFQTLDIKKEGYQEAFDLVFSSLTPALRSGESLFKAIGMSRRWCCNITHLSRRDSLQEQIMRDVFGRRIPQRWDGRWFYGLFNLLFLLGYEPETSYDTRRRELWVRPDEVCAEYLMEQMLPEQEQTMGNADKIQNWLLSHQNEEGLVREVADASYGRILWDVQKRTRRPEYGGWERSGRSDSTQA